MSREWAMPTWLFFHTLIANIPESQYVAKDVLNQIKAVCAVLPCPDCASHATAYLSKIEPNHVPLKEDCRRMLWAFHNSVNQRTRKPPFAFDKLSIYSRTALRKIFEVFAEKFTKRKFATKLFTDALMRDRIISRLRAWLSTLDFSHREAD